MADIRLTEAEMIAEELGRALRGDAWHGPSLIELLEGVTADDAMQRSIPVVHNIWEIVLHLTSWANIALRRIAGGQVQPFEDEDWPPTGEMTANRWWMARQELAESYERLRDITVAMTEARLDELAPQSERTIAMMLHGVVQHSAYHGGQIALLKKSIIPYHRRAAI
ncbi:MAG: DinB family protein [Gemmatimonadaceae bacterium]